MHTILKYSQLIISVLLILSILIQARSAGLTSGQMSSSASFQTARRGPEKVIYNASIVFAVLFVLNSLAFLFV